MARLTIRTQEELLALATGMARAQIDQQMHIQAAARHGLVGALMVAIGLSVPEIISGFRAHSFQAGLREVKGNDGQFLQPARRSWHTRGLAYDLDQSAEFFDIYAILWKLLGGRDGRDFSNPDPGHFDIPVAGLEPDPSF